MTKQRSWTVPADALKAALAEMRAVVGNEWVFVDPETELPAYYDEYSVFPAGEEIVPVGAVAPANVEQIQKIVRIARTHSVALAPISTGKNFAYGGPAPLVPGCVTLDLRRMNRVIEVNTKHGYAVVEPGVSYLQLYAYLQERGIKLWIDPAAPGWGGVMGNLLDHGAGYTPYGDHLMMQCGMELVLSDGTLVHTGMGGLPNQKAWHVNKAGAGPSVDGIFTQSNFAVVTKIGIWLMPEPPGYMPFLVTLPREEDLEALIDIVRPLKVNMLIPNAATAVHISWEAAVTAPRAKFYTGPGAVPASVMKKIADDLDLGVWNFHAALYGPEPMMKNTWKVVESELRKIPGAKFHFDRTGDVSWDYRTKLERGVPNMVEYALLNWLEEGGSHTDFSPISACTGSEAMKQFEMIRNRCNEFGIDYIGEFLVGWREMHHILILAFERWNPEHRARAFDLFTTLVGEAAAAGYGEYRTHAAFMDSVAKTYNYNDGALWKLHHRIKDSLDPTGILAPGKQGIWPKVMRESSKS